MAGNVSIARILMDDFKFYKVNANPNCTVCEGNGVVLDADKLKNMKNPYVSARRSGKTEVTRMSISRICPICFDPDGNPRDGKKVKK